MPTKTKKKPSKTPKVKTAKTTLLSFILDETGSMQSVQVPTISGFNEYLNTMRKSKGEVLFTLTKFNTAKVDTTNLKPIKDVPELNNESYQPNHGTPLYDAIGRTINSMEHELKGRKDKPAILVTIMTDGEENSSHEFNRDQILKLIEAKTKEGWTFTFLGANQDAWQVGASIGVAVGNSMTYDQNKTKGVFAGVANAHCSYMRSEGTLNADLLTAKNMDLNEAEYKDLTGGKTPKQP